MTDEGLTFHEPVKYLTEKAKNTFHVLNRSISRLYRFKGKSLRTIFRAAILPLVAYGAELFEDRLNYARIKSKLNSLWGLVARTITATYISTSPSIDAAAAIMERIGTSNQRKEIEVNKNDNDDDGKTELA